MVLTNIEYGKSQWYCTTVQIDKDNTTDMHGPWHELPVGDSISVDAISTAIPCAVITTHTCPANQNISPTSPMKTKKVHKYLSW